MYKEGIYDWKGQLSFEGVIREDLCKFSWELLTIGARIEDGQSEYTTAEYGIISTPKGQFYYLNNTLLRFNLFAYSSQS